MWLNIQTMYSEMVMSITKDTNDTVDVYFTWPVQTGFTTDPQTGPCLLTAALYFRYTVSK